MYKLNSLQRNVLITVDEVIFHAPTKHTLDPRTIQQSIIVAEERLIRPLIGYDFYEALIVEKNVVVDDSNKADLQAKYDLSKSPGAATYTLKNGDVINAFEQLSADNKKLWTEHLWKLTAECVIFSAYPDAFVQFASEGVIHTTPSSLSMAVTGANTPDLKSVRWSMDKKLQDRIDPLIESLHLYVCKQKAADSAKFPLYVNDCDCDTKGTPYKKRSQFISNVYEDDTEDCGCR